MLQVYIVCLSERLLNSRNNGRNHNEVESCNRQEQSESPILYTEAENDFVDFLFNLFTLLVGTVIMLLTEKGMMGCLRDLYQSVENLSETYMQPNQNKPLLKPIFLRSSYCTLPTPKKFYICL